MSTKTLSVISRVSVENLRKPFSFAFFALWVVIALFTVPPELEQTGWREVAELTGYLLLIAAALGRIWAFAYIGGRKNRELCQKGPYALTRNPLYFFSFLGVVGACLALEHVLLLSVTVPAFLTYYWFVIRAEERRLAILFGRDFATYSEQVPRFWPRLAAPERTGILALDVRLFTRPCSLILD